MGKDVEPRLDASRDQLHNERLLVHDSAARRVDQAGAVAEKRQPAGVEQAARLVGQRQVQADGIGLGEQLVELAPTYVGARSRVAEHPHVERRGALRDGSADPAETHDPER